MHVRIKICGITNPADAELAGSLGADMVGLNFYRKSPRHIDADMARSILGALPAAVEPIALIVNEPIAQAQRLAQQLGIGTVQLHGDLPERLLAGTSWISAMPVRDAAGLQEIIAQLDRLRAAGVAPAAILVDAHVLGQYGGTGQTAPWHLLADFHPGVPLILAGGLTADNVAEAIRIVRPDAVDVASGVESRPGNKDPDKLRRFIDAVRRVSGEW